MSELIANIGIVGWIISTAVGGLLAVIGVIEAGADLRAIRELPRNGRYLIARQALLRHSLRLMIYVAWAGAIIASFAKVPEATILLLVGANVLLAGITASDLFVGAILRRIFDPRRNREPDR